MNKNKLTMSSLAEKRSAESTADSVIAGIFDEETFAECAAYYTKKDGNLANSVTGYGAVNGRLAYIYAEDSSRDGGAFGAVNAEKLVRTIKAAAKSSAVLLAVFDSKGAYVDEGAECFAAYGKVQNELMESRYYTSMPSIALIKGNCSGYSAVIARMFDIVILASDKAELSVTPSSLSGKCDAVANGSADLRFAKEEEAFAAIRRIISLIPSYDGEATDDANRTTDALEALNKDYDVSTVLEAIADNGSYVAFASDFAKEMSCGLITLNGRSCGYVATNPAVKDGALTVDGAYKAVRTIKICSKLNLPVVTLIDSVGYENSNEAESSGYSVAIGTLARAYSVCDTKITAITGKCYGSAFCALGTKSLGADMVMAAENAKISPIAPETYVQLMKFDEIKAASDPKAKRAELVAQYESEISAAEAAAAGEVDQIIPMSQLRMRIISALEMAN